jgi:hypothetical protein
LAGGRNLRAQAKFGKAGGYRKSFAAREPTSPMPIRLNARGAAGSPLSQKEMAGTSPAMTFDVDRS